MTGKNSGSMGTERGGILRPVSRATLAPICSGAGRTPGGGWKARAPNTEGRRDSDFLAPLTSLGKGTPAGRGTPTLKSPRPSTVGVLSRQVPQQHPIPPCLAEHAGKGSSRPRRDRRRSAGSNSMSQGLLRCCPGRAVVAGATAVLRENLEKRSRAGGGTEHHQRGTEMLVEGRRGAGEGAAKGDRRSPPRADVRRDPSQPQNRCYF